MDIRQVVGDVPFFAGALDDEHLDALAAGSRLVAFDPGAVVFEEDDNAVGTTMYVVVAGAFTVAVHDEGKAQEVATLTKGQIFGEMSLLTGLPRLGTVTAGEGAEAIEIPFVTLKAMLSDSPALFERLAGMLQKRQGDLDQIIDPGFWERHGRSPENLAWVMRRHFEETT